MKKSISLNNNVKNSWKFINQVMNKENSNTIARINNNDDIEQLIVKIFGKNTNIHNLKFEIGTKVLIIRN